MEVVQKQVQESDLRPALRAVSHRTTFQHSDSSAIKIYLDSSIQLVLEGAPGSIPSHLRPSFPSLLSQVLTAGSAILQPSLLESSSCFPWV